MPTLKPIRPVAYPLEARRAEIERARSIEGKLHEVYGFVETSGTGEALLDANFPVAFFEKPAFSQGGELAENQPLEDGNFPVINAAVARWKTSVKNGKTYYIGAFLAIVIDGPSSLHAFVHWQVRGRALRNPLTGLEGTDEAI